MWTERGEWVFRPLRNPPRTTTCTFRLDSPRGFGLLQRDRDFDSYQDLEKRYQDRPSAWIEPIGDWGKGAIRLLEIATELETDDNIAMLWAPDQVPETGLDLHYRVYFGPGIPHVAAPGRATATRLARTGERSARFVVDFAGEAVAARKQGAELHVAVSGGKLLAQQLEPNQYTGGMRASFEVAAENADVEMRAFLRNGADVLTETWSYLWQPVQ
jgi:glucans biosynthesis protein